MYSATKKRWTLRRKKMYCATKKRWTLKMKVLVVVVGMPGRKRIVVQARRRRRKEEEEEQQQPPPEDRSALWSGLPQDLLIRILAFLPVHKLLELQTVCKSWRSLFQSPHMEFAPRETWLVMIRNSLDVLDFEIIAFSPTANRWCHLPPSIWRRGDMASAGGLIVHPSPDQPHCLEVFNLLTKATKTLYFPGLPDRRPLVSFQLTMLAGAGFYQVILISKPCSETGRLTGHFIAVFDSRTQGWEWTVGHSNGHNALVYDSGSQSWESKPRHCGRRGSTPHIVPDDDDLFVLDEPNGAVLTYNAERRIWSTLKTPLPTFTAKGGGRLNLVLETLLKRKGRLLLLGALHLESEEEDSWTIEGLGVWEWKSVGQGTGIWAELARTPPEYWEPYPCLGPGGFSTHLQLHCSVANDNLICMIGGEIDDLVLDIHYWPPLAYDLDRGSWQRLPSSFCGDKPDCLGFFEYEPSWNAVP